MPSFRSQAGDAQAGSCANLLYGVLSLLGLFPCDANRRLLCRGLALPAARGRKHALESALFPNGSETSARCGNQLSRRIRAEQMSGLTPMRGRGT